MMLTSARILLPFFSQAAYPPPDSPENTTQLHHEVSVALSAVSYIGVIVSIISLAITVVTYLSSA
jgi:hypothetical protein